MAGQIPLGTRYYPGDFQLSTFTTHAPTHGKYPILYVDRTIVVDSVSFMLEEAPNQNITVKIVSVPWPNVPNFNNPITGQVDITNSISLGTSDPYPKARVTGDSSGFDKYGQQPDPDDQRTVGPCKLGLLGCLRKPQRGNALAKHLLNKHLFLQGGAIREGGPFFFGILEA